LLLALPLLAGVLVTRMEGPASARSAAVLPYPVSEVWSTAVRFIRVDRNCVIKEKDEGSGYILFEMAEGSKKYQGSLELIRAVDGEGRASTRATFSLPDLPRHFEGNLMDKLGIKVREERGSPAAPPPRKAPADARPDAAAR
jgi:hypothetical protein